MAQRRGEDGSRASTTSDASKPTPEEVAMGIVLRMLARWVGRGGGARQQGLKKTVGFISHTTVTTPIISLIRRNRVIRKPG